MKQLSDVFEHPEKIVDAIYANGGINVGGWGFLSGGYGGGIEQDQAFTLTYFKGYIDGLAEDSMDLRKEILREINQELRDRGVAEAKLPFINLD